MCLRTFLYEIQFQTTFIRSFFYAVCIFTSVRPSMQKFVHFPLTNVNSSVDGQGAIFNIMHAGEPLN